MIMAQSYYLMTWNDTVTDFGMARAIGQSELAFEIISSVVDSGRAPDFELIEGKPMDYMGNSLAWPLMSRGLRSVFEACSTGVEGVKWATALIRQNDHTQEYYIPIFTRELDVINKKGTIFASGTDFIVRPCFDLKKIEKLAFFYKPDKFWRITSSIYVNAHVRKEIVDARLSGIAFEKVAVA